MVWRQGIKRFLMVSVSKGRVDDYTVRRWESARCWILSCGLLPVIEKCTVRIHGSAYKIFVPSAWVTWQISGGVMCVDICAVHLVYLAILLELRHWDAVILKVMWVLLREMPCRYGESLAIYGWNLNRHFLHLAWIVGLWMADFVGNMSMDEDHKAHISLPSALVDQVGQHWSFWVLQLRHLAAVVSLECKPRPH